MEVTAKAGRSTNWCPFACVVDVAMQDELEVGTTLDM